MKNLKPILIALMIGLLTCSPIWAQQQTIPPSVNGVVPPIGQGAYYAPEAIQTINAGLSASSTGCATANSCVALTLGSYDATANINVSGTFSATLQFEATLGDGNWSAISCPTYAYGAAASSTTATGAWTCGVSAKAQLRVRVSAYTSGTANVAIASSQGASGINSIPVPQGLSTSSTPNFATAPQVVGMNTSYFMPANVTSGAANVALTGLTWTVPASTALNYNFHCELTFTQATAATANAFTITNSVAATNGTLWGSSTITGTYTGAIRTVTKAFTATTASTIVSVTPTTTGTDEIVQLEGFIEQPSGSASTVQIGLTTTSGATDVTTVARDSWCRLF